MAEVQRHGAQAAERTCKSSICLKQQQLLSPTSQGYIFIYKVHEQFKLPPINGKDPMCQDDSPFPTTPVSPLASLLPSTVSSLSQLPRFKKSTSSDCSVFVQHPGKGQDLTFPVTPTCPLTPPPKGTVFKVRQT